MNARLDSELAARYADYSVAREAWKLAQQDGDQRLASDIRLNRLTDNDFNKALFKRERELGHPLSEDKVMKDFRTEMVQYSDGYYLKKFAEEAVNVAPSLDQSN